MPSESLNLKGVEVTVDFDYQPPERGSYWEPPVDEEYTINGVSVNGVDISGLLSEDIYHDIEAILDANAKAYNEDMSFNEPEDRYAYDY